MRLRVNLSRLVSSQAAELAAEVHAVSKTLNQAIMNSLAVVLLGRAELPNGIDQDLKTWVCPHCQLEEIKLDDEEALCPSALHLQHCSAQPGDRKSASTHPYSSEWKRLDSVQRLCAWLKQRGYSLPGPIDTLVRRRRTSRLHMYWDLEEAVHRLNCTPGSPAFRKILSSIHAVMRQQRAQRSVEGAVGGWIRYGKDA